ncbi:MAG TPA: DUF4381 family protein [Bdellovibrionales bacterium]|nr:DUF4381 family protein [Bdellovibrionales bacterium]
MSAPLPVWRCTFVESAKEWPLDNLTVGAHFRLGCEGDIPVEWTPDQPVRVDFAKKEDGYSLHILKSETLEPQKATFLVTGYKAGQHAPEYIRLTQDGKGFEVAKPTWQIRSVLNPQEQPQPFPSFGPWAIPPPLWILIAVGAVILLLALALWRFLRRRRQRGRMLAELERHRTAMPPVHQFYRDSRQLHRRLATAKSVEELKALSDDLDREFRLYLLRRFQIPTLDWSDREILTDLRKRHRKVYSVAGEPLRKTLRELRRLTTQEQMLLVDVEQLYRMSLDAVERTEAAK